MLGFFLSHLHRFIFVYTEFYLTFFPAATSCSSLQMVFLATVSKIMQNHSWLCWLAEIGHKFHFLVSTMIQSSCRVRDSNSFLLPHCLCISLWENTLKTSFRQRKLMETIDKYMSLNMRTSLFWGLSNVKQFLKSSAKVVLSEQNIYFIFRSIRFTHLPGWGKHDYIAYTNTLQKGHQHHNFYPYVWAL